MPKNKKRKNTKGSIKGGSFERKIAKQLSLWWTEGDGYEQRDDIFYRTDGSGGRATVRAKQGTTTANSCGDLSYLDISGKPFVDLINIEIKCGYSRELDILDLADGYTKKKHTILKWIEKAELEAENAGRKYIMIIFKRNYRNPAVVMPLQLLAHLETYCGPFEPIDSINISLRLEEDYEIFALSDFMRYFDRAGLLGVAEAEGL